MVKKLQKNTVLNKSITILCALIFRTVLAVGSLLITMFSVVVMVPFKNLSSIGVSAQYIIEVHNFIPAVFFSLVALIIPIVINSIFYSLWFGKKSISMLWVRIPDVIFALIILIIMCFNLFVFNNNWSEAEWVW